MPPAELPDVDRGNRRSLALLLSLWGTLASGSTLGAMFSPVLVVKYPAVLIALSPLYRHFLLVVPQLDPWTFFSIGLVRRLLGIFLFYSFGYLYGQRAITWIERSWPLAGRWVRWVERLFARVGAPLVLIPSVTIWVLAGTARTPPVVFGVLSACSVLATLAMVWSFGGLWASPLQWLLEWLRQYMWEATTATVVGLGLVQVVRLRRRPLRTARDSMAPPAA